MLRYVEQTGLVTARRTDSGYRIYGAEELQRLRTLKELLARFEVALSDVAFAERLRSDPELQAAVNGWLQATAERPDEVTPDAWLEFEKRKHERLLSAA
jgi:DNA-binding transcriptional MerR regulator